MLNYALWIALMVGAWRSASAQGAPSVPASMSAQPTPKRKTIVLPNNRAAPVPVGPYDTTWASVKANYSVPQWFREAKFGIMMHWGLYAVPAHASEWYARHMYSNEGVAKWHQEHFGPQDTFGYKDFIPLFTAEKFNPDEWAALFKKAGARYVVPTAEHHDGFALYDSKLTRWDAKDMGPKRDLIGDLAKAVRKQGMKFGVSNHRIENWDFMYPQLALKNDLFDPAYADFYGPPQKPAEKKKPAAGGEEVMDDQGAPQSQAFLEEWLARCQELVDTYQPDLFWFDNGVNSRKLDPIKLRFAAYYYNRAAAWGKQVSISTKSDAFLAGSIRDFERQSRAPKQITDYVWQVDDPVLYRFGYTEGSPIANPGSVITRLVENVSKNGALLLNISPRADGTIPDDQQKLLLAVGKWLDTNGEAIYGTHAWTTFGEDPVARTDSTAKPTKQPRFRFTVKGDVLYATALGWPDRQAVLTALSERVGRVRKVSLLGSTGTLAFRQDKNGLTIELPGEKQGDYAYVFKVEGLTLRP